MRLLLISLLLLSGQLWACPDSTERILLRHLATPDRWEERLTLCTKHVLDTCETWQLERAWTLDRLHRLEEADAAYQKKKTAWTPADTFMPAYIWHLFQTRQLPVLSTLNHHLPEVDYCLQLLQEQPDSLIEQTAYTHLNSAYREYRSTAQKSVLLAGLLSVIPGLGKAYCGYRKQAVMSVIINTGLGIILTETLLRQGFGSAVFYGALALSSTFWIGSVYGTVVSLKKEKKDRLDALYLEITDHFLSAYARYPQ